MECEEADELILLENKHATLKLVYANKCMMYAIHSVHY